MIVYPEFNERNTEESFPDKLNRWVKKYWFNTLLVLLALNIVFTKNFSVQIGLVNKDQIEQTPVGSQVVKEKISLRTPASESNTGVQAVAIKKKNALAKREVSGGEPTLGKAALAGVGFAAAAAAKMIGEEKAVHHKASDFGNLPFVLHPELADRKKVPLAIVDEKSEYCRKYVERFAKVAIAEMEKYGIPASITLAQGLLETNAGDSRLSNESNNHFGIKCKTKCLGCTCRNYKDDDVYDMFRVFDSAWESYREHSLLLSGKRYKHLKAAGTKNYKKWAYGLKAAGYATDAKYAEKLVQIIEELDLYQFDK